MSVPPARASRAYNDSGSYDEGALGELRFRLLLAQVFERPVLAMSGGSLPIGIDIILLRQQRAILIDLAIGLRVRGRGRHERVMLHPALQCLTHGSHPARI